MRFCRIAGAVVSGTSFAETAKRGFNHAQLASTASYQAKDLQSIALGFNDMTGWDQSGQNLSFATFFLSTLTNANLAGTNLTHANVSNAILANAKVCRRANRPASDSRTDRIRFAHTGNLSQPTVVRLAFQFSLRFNRQLLMNPSSKYH